MSDLPKPYYQDEAVTIYHGDCQGVLPALGEEMADMVLTDPPYGFERFETDAKDFLSVVGPALRMTWKCLVYGGSMFVFSGTGKVVDLANAIDQPLKRMLWMYKRHHYPAYPFHGWLLTSEAILWFGKGNPLNLVDRHPYRDDCYVVQYQRDREWIRGHPAVKPLSVCLDLVSRCPEGGIVLDPFAGSGTTGRAAKDLGRRAILIEIEERYCELAARRMAQMVLL